MRQSLFRRQELIRFQHCDPAGIVFYPRYAEMVNATIEDWFAAVIGIDFAKIHIEMETAIPAATLKLDFRLPSRIGEVLEMGVEVERLGRTSVSLEVRAHCREQLRFESWITLVHVPKTSYRPEPWPEQMRAALAAKA